MLCVLMVNSQLILYQRESATLLCFPELVVVDMVSPCMSKQNCSDRQVIGYPRLADGRRFPLAFAVPVDYHKGLVYREPPFHLPIKTQGLFNVHFCLKKLDISVQENY